MPDLFFGDLDTHHARRAARAGALQTWRSPVAGRIARLRTVAPALHDQLGSRATVARSERAARLANAADHVPDAAIQLADIVTVSGGVAKPNIEILETESGMPMGRALRALCHPRPLPHASSSTRLTLLFVNTRMQAEMLFQELWAANEDMLPIAMHHGSLAVEQRRKVEAAMSEAPVAGSGLRPRRSTSASTGAMWTSWCRSARPRGRPGCCSASAAPITGSMNRRRRCSSPPTGSRCWNARRRSKRSLAQPSG
jgi:hypothetical protein